MTHRIADEEFASRLMHGIAICAAATTMFVALVATNAVAQTSAPATTPAPKAESQSKWSVPAPKTAPVKPATSCSAYGEGFVPVPGTDTCVKAGGYLRTEGAFTFGR